MSLEDLYNGKDFEAQINKQVICRQCGGSGAENVRRGKGWGTGLGTAAGSWEFWGFGILSLGVSLGLGWVFTVLCVDPSTRVESLVQGYIYMQGCFFFFFCCLVETHSGGAPWYSRSLLSRPSIARPPFAGSPTMFSR